MAPLKGRRWENGYRFHPLRIKTAGREFCFSRRGSASTGSGAEKGVEFVPSNLAAAWTPYGEESLIGGVLQGRKQFDPRGASMLCRKSMWKLAAEVAALVAIPAVSQVLSLGSYELVKSASLLEGRRKVKEEVKEKALKGWVRNSGDEGFGLDAGSQSVNE
jgi:tRNA-specific adenosine deaminase 1